MPVHPHSGQATPSRSSVAVMRTISIIAGQYRGRKIMVLDAPDLRPSCHRIRGAIVNTVIHRFYPQRVGQALPLGGLKVADLYAGTGAYGLEALSLGASHVTFVEAHGPTAQHLDKTLTSLGLESLGQVMACQWPAARAPLGPFDLVFLDPPYQLAEKKLHEALVAARAVLADGGLIALEHPAPPQDVAGLTLHHRKQWGAKAAGFYTPTPLRDVWPRNGEAAG